MEHNENVVICPPCGENVGLPTKRGANKENLFLPLLPRLTAVLPPQGREITTHGFTLIELLVVVLIIGILAAVAVPQYQKAVLKSKVNTVLPIMKNLWQAEESYFLSNGEYSYNVHRLDIDMPSNFVELSERGVRGEGGQVFSYGTDFIIDNSGDSIMAIFCPKNNDVYSACIKNRDFSLYIQRLHESEQAGQAGCISWTNLGKYICDTTTFNQWTIEKTRLE